MPDSSAVPIFTNKTFSKAHVGVDLMKQILFE